MSETPANFAGDFDPPTPPGITPESLMLSYRGLFTLLEAAKKTLPELDPNDEAEASVHTIESYFDDFPAGEDTQIPQTLNDRLAEVNALRMRARLRKQAREVAWMEAFMEVHLNLAHDVARDRLDVWRPEAEALMRQEHGEE